MTKTKEKESGESVIDLGKRGKYNTKNKLNNLTGKEWIKFSKSWFIHRPPRRKKDEILHPAKFPETLVEEFISFFTKEGEWILDPFMGTGSAMVAAGNLKRNAVGVELSPEFFKVAKKRIEKNKSRNDILPLKGSSYNLKDLIARSCVKNVLFDYTITSPPYWNQLERNSLRQKSRMEKGLSTKYSENKEDLGNISDYYEFIERQAKIFDNVYDVTKPNGYLTVITNNVYYKGRLFPLAFDTAISLARRNGKSWVLKDEKIWLQDDKALVALGVNNAWVANRHHQYCLIFRKEINHNQNK